MQSSPSLKALGYAALYALLGGLWILLSDRALTSHTDDPALLTALQTWKGWFYVGLTAVLSYVLVLALLRSEARRLRKEQDHAGELHAIINHLPGHTLYLDPERRIRFASDNIAMHLGQPVEALIGKTDAEAFGTAPGSTHADKLETAYGGHEVRFEHSHTLPDGRTLQLLTHFLPDIGPGATIRGIYVFSIDLTEHMRLEQELRWRNDELESIFQSLPDIYFRMDTDGTILEYRARRASDLYVPPEHFLGRRAQDLLPPENAEQFSHKLAELHEQGTMQTYEYMLPLAGGARRFEARLTRLPGREEVVAVVRDITERHLAEEQQRLSARVFSSTRDGLMVTDADRHILAINPAFSEITGYEEREALGQTPRLLHSGRHDAAFYRAMWQAIEESGEWQGEIWNRRKNGEIYPEWLTISTMRDDTGAISHYVGVFSDISRIKQVEADLEHLAHHDPLTGLPNRILFLARLEHALEQARRNHEQLAVLFLDLDRFKNVNDSLGHPVGDQLLHAIAQRLRNELRKEDTLARLGGDEFVILLERMHHADEVAKVAQDVIRLLETPIPLDAGPEIYIGASLGISLYPQDGDDPTTLIRNADAALYQAKASGRHHFRFYTRSLTDAVNRKLELEMAMRRALERNEFLLHYQPLVRIGDGRLTGLEVLLRWRDEDGGLIAPDEFIPTAEDTGLIVPIGEWALRAACRQGRAWLDAGLPPILLAVNLSPRQFNRPQLVETVRSILDDTGYPAGHLELEITETALMESSHGADEQLKALKALGVSLAIDDFGTGYSSLAYLKRFPVNKLKIDKGFIQHLPDDPEDVAIAETIIHMASTFQFEVLAEGVETKAQLQFLREKGCHSYQGYLFSRPLPADEIEGILRKSGD